MLKQRRSNWSPPWLSLLALQDAPLCFLPLKCSSWRRHILVSQAQATSSVSTYFLHLISFHYLHRPYNCLDIPMHWMFQENPSLYSARCSQLNRYSISWPFWTIVAYIMKKGLLGLDFQLLTCHSFIDVYVSKNMEMSCTRVLCFCLVTSGDSQGYF